MWGLEVTRSKIYSSFGFVDDEVDFFILIDGLISVLDQIFADPQLCIGRSE